MTDNLSRSCVKLSSVNKISTAFREMTFQNY